MASVELRDIRKSYAALEVVHGVSLSIAEGEFIALVGPSGCGKSTLLRMIAGLEEISDGEVLIGGKVVNPLTPRERNIAMVFQSYALYPHMSVAENMGFNPQALRSLPSEIDRKVSEAARMLALTELLDRKPSQLSGGQRQRVAMGRRDCPRPGRLSCSTNRSPISMPSSGLQMRTEIKALHQKVATTSIYVTPRPDRGDDARRPHRRLERGRIEQVGTPLEL